jgi:hypothetical protein
MSDDWWVKRLEEENRMEEETDAWLEPLLDKIYKASGFSVQDDKIYHGGDLVATVHDSRFVAFFGGAGETRKRYAESVQHFLPKSRKYAGLFLQGTAWEERK